jgi:hypothetical protein
MPPLRTEAAAAGVANSAPNRFEPLYDTHPLTGAVFEVFYADRTLETFGRCGPGWFWWCRRRGFAPDGERRGPFATRYAAYRDAVSDGGRLTRSYPPPVAIKAATSDRATRNFDVLCFHIASAIKRRGSTIRAMGQEPQLFQMVTGAPEEIRTPDPQIRSLVL